MSAPSVSVLLPSYHPKISHLREALDSLFAQTHADWKLTILQQPWGEIYVKSWIEEYLKDPRVALIESNTERTIGANWNACLEYIDAPYVQFLFHDDVWDPTYLERSMQILEQHPDVGFCSANHEYLFEGDVPNQDLYKNVQDARMQILDGKHNGKELLKNWLNQGLHPNIIGEPSFVMMRSDAIKQVEKFSETLPQFLDSEYWTRILSISDFYFIPDSLGSFRVHDEGMSAINRKTRKGMTDRLKTINLLKKSDDAEIAQLASKIFWKQLPRMIVKFFHTPAHTAP